MATSTLPRFRPDSSASYLGSIADGGPTSPEAITRTLTNVLEAEDYPDRVNDLHGAGIDPQSYIDGLDKVGPRLSLTLATHLRPFESQAIDIISPASDIHERCVRALRKACGLHRLLPDSHTVRSVLTPGPRPVVPGGFSDVWKAENENGEVFAIKVLRVYQDSVVLVKKVWGTGSINSPLPEIS